MPRAKSSRNVFGALSGANALMFAASLVTGPILARSLGPSGRGDFAAVAVPLGFAPIIFTFGLGAYASREAARGRSVALLAGSLLPIALVVGGVAMVAAAPIASLVAGDRTVVYRYVLIGFLLLPIGLVGQILWAIALGLERWQLVLYTRIVPPLLSLTTLIVLTLLGQVTVSTVAALTVLIGVVSVLPAMCILRGAGRPRFDTDIIRKAVPFGLRSWLGVVGAMSTARLDQLLMVRLVSSSQLGLYAVAVTLASLPAILTQALQLMLIPRAAVGDFSLIARASRLTLSAVSIAGLAIAGAAPLVLPTLFGTDFADAVPMAWVLVVGAVPLAGCTILASALESYGHPGVVARGQILALIITVSGLVLLLDRFGAIGAAVTTAVAYTANFSWLVAHARRLFALDARKLLVLDRDDVVWAFWQLRGGRTSRSAV